MNPCPIRPGRAISAAVLVAALMLVGGSAWAQSGRIYIDKVSWYTVEQSRLRISLYAAPPTEGAPALDTQALLAKTRNLFDQKLRELGVTPLGADKDIVCASEKQKGIDGVEGLAFTCSAPFDPAAKRQPTPLSAPTPVAVVAPPPAASAAPPAVAKTASAPAAVAAATVVAKPAVPAPPTPGRTVATSSSAALPIASPQTLTAAAAAAAAGADSLNQAAARQAAAVLQQDAEAKAAYARTVRDQQSEFDKQTKAYEATLAVAAAKKVEADAKKVADDAQFARDQAAYQQQVAASEVAARKYASDKAIADQAARDYQACLAGDRSKCVKP